MANKEKNMNDNTMEVEEKGKQFGSWSRSGQMLLLTNISVTGTPVHGKKKKKKKKKKVDSSD